MSNVTLFHPLFLYPGFDILWCFILAFIGCTWLWSGALILVIFCSILVFAQITLFRPLCILRLLTVVYKLWYLNTMLLPQRHFLSFFIQIQNEQNLSKKHSSLFQVSGQRAGRFVRSRGGERSGPAHSPYQLPGHHYFCLAFQPAQLTDNITNQILANSDQFEKN